MAIFVLRFEICVLQDVRRLDKQDGIVAQRLWFSVDYRGCFPCDCIGDFPKLQLVFAVVGFDDNRSIGRIFNRFIGI